jgi:hypothetical protein
MECLNSLRPVLPTQHAAWLQCAAECFGTGTFAPSLGAGVWDCGLAPVRIGGGPRRLMPIGAAETGEPSDLPWQSDDDLKHRATQLARQPFAIDLPRVPVGSKSLAALRQASAGHGMVVAREAPGSPFILLDASWVEPESRFNAGRRSDFRRARRHAETLGSLSFEMHSQLDAAQLDAYLDEAYAVEARSWKGEAGTAMAVDPALGLFFRRYAHAALEAGILRLSFMRIGGLAVGMQLAVEHERSLWLLKIGYDPAYAKCSPGNLLMLYTLGEAARRGLLSYEFFGRTAPWTAQWTTDLRAYSRIRFYPRSVHGALALAQDGVTAMCGRLRNRRALKDANLSSQAPSTDKLGLRPALAP